MNIHSMPYVEYKIDRPNAHQPLKFLLNVVLLYKSVLLYSTVMENNGKLNFDVTLWGKR